jgi:hypothetical protein
MSGILGTSSVSSSISFFAENTGSIMRSKQILAFHLEHGYSQEQLVRILLMQAYCVLAYFDVYHSSLVKKGLCPVFKPRNFLTPFCKTAVKLEMCSDDSVKT